MADGGPALVEKNESNERLKLEERKRDRQSVVMYIHKGSSSLSPDAIIANSDSHGGRGDNPML